MMLPVAILAGGLATRMRPMTNSIPKSLLPVAGVPFAEYQLRLLRKSGAREVVMCVGHLGEMIERTLGDGSRLGLSIRYSYDGDQPCGTGGALIGALKMLGDAFLVMYGDSYLDCDYAAVERQFLTADLPGLMAIIRHGKEAGVSNVLFKDGRILLYDKKMNTSAMAHIDYGIGALRSEILMKFQRQLPLDLADIYQDLSLRGELAPFVVHKRFYEIGSPEGLREFERYIKEIAP